MDDFGNVLPPVKTWATAYYFNLFYWSSDDFSPLVHEDYEWC